MIKGIGSDIIEIERVEQAISKNDRFLTRFFTEAERNLFQERKNNSETIAANFAIKEAVSKAFGTGFRGIELNEIEGLRDQLGKPYAKLSGKALAKQKEMGIQHIHVTVSHNKTNAVAFVVFEGDE